MGGPTEIEGLTDKVNLRRLMPKRANKIRKMFNLSKDDDVRAQVNMFKREIVREGKPKNYYKRPKIQRLVTPQVLQRKRRRLADKRRRYQAQKKAAAKYAQLLARQQQERRAARALHRRRRSSSRRSETA